jgi:hypothetical protein
MNGPKRLQTSRAATNQPSGYKPAERLQTSRAATNQPSGYGSTGQGQSAMRLPVNRRQILVLVGGEALLLARPLDHPIFHPVGGW